MQCPNDNEKLEAMLFHDVEVEYCPRCMGIWFDYDEFRLAKDDKDKQLNWMDVDLWRDHARFELTRADKHCPRDRTGLLQVRYDHSRVRVDVCNYCKGVWLDRGEFKQIINYLKEKSDYALLDHYIKQCSRQLWEVFSGPASFREELGDVLMLLKLFNYKFAAQYPLLNSLIENGQK